MKVVKKPCIVFDAEEIKALQTIACIDCSGIHCHEDACPFNCTQGETTHCIKGEIKEMMLKRGISF